MSLLFKPNSARLSVIGNGWNNVSFDSGGGFVFDDLLWSDIAFDFEFPDLDFPNLDLPDFDLSDIIFDLDGTIYVEIDGAWRDPLTGALYPGGGDMWMSEDMALDAAKALSNISDRYKKALRYNSTSNFDSPQDYHKAVEVVVGRDSTPFNYRYYYIKPYAWVIEYPNYGGTFLCSNEPFTVNGEESYHAENFLMEKNKTVHYYHVRAGAKYSFDGMKLVDSSVEPMLPMFMTGEVNLPEDHLAAQVLYGNYRLYLMKNGCTVITENDGSYSVYGENRDGILKKFDTVKIDALGLKSREWNGKKYYMV